ncbi:hypothetical protein [Streptomyces griseosporeus]
MANRPERTVAGRCFDPAAVLRHFAYQQTAGPVGKAAQYTSMCDARTALALSLGTSVDDIDPSSGYSMSRHSYDSIRHSWIESIKYRGFSAYYEQKSLDEARTYWLERRPEFIAEDDWLAVGMAAHHEYWDELGRSCNRPTCDEHGDGLVMLQAAKEVNQS